MGGDSLRQEQRHEAQVSRDVSGQSTYQVQRQQQAPYGGPEAREASSLGTLTKETAKGLVYAIEQQLIEQVRQQYVSSVEQAHRSFITQVKAQGYAPQVLKELGSKAAEWKQLQLEAFNVAVQSPEKYQEWLQQHSQEIISLAGMKGVASLAKLADIHSQIEQAAQAKARGEAITATAFAAGIGAVAVAPVAALSGAAAGATFETVKTGIMEGKLPTAEQLITSAGLSAAGAAVMSAAAPVLSKAASAGLSKILPEEISGLAAQAGRTLTSTGVAGVLSREALGTGIGAAAGAAEAAVKGENVLKGAAAGAVAGAAAAAVGEIAFRGLSHLEQEILGVKAYRVKGVESYEVTRETEEAVGGSRTTKVEVEPTRISKEQAELLRYTQIEKIETAGTADVTYKGGGDILKQTGIGWEASYQGKAAQDIMQAASRGGGIVTETVYMEKAPGVGQLRLAEYEAATAKLTGVQAFGKIDPQVYLSFIKNVPPEVAGEWLTQMGGLPVSQLSQVTAPISIVMHEVFALPAATVSAGAVAGAIAGATVSGVIQPKIEPPKIDVSPVVSIPQKGSTVQPQLEKTSPVLDVSPNITITAKLDKLEKETSSIVTPEPIVKPEPSITPKQIVKPDITPELDREILHRITPHHRITPKPDEWQETLPITTPEITPQVTPKPITTPEIIPHHRVTPKPIITPDIITTPEVTPQITPKPITTPEITIKPEPAVVPSPVTRQVERAETFTITTTTTTPATPKLLQKFGTRHEGVRAPDFGRLLFGGKYVKRHEIALPSQVAKQVLTVSTRSKSKTGVGVPSSLIFGKQSRRGAGAGLGGSFSSFVFDVGGRRRGSRKSLLKGSLAEVVFG